MMSMAKNRREFRILGMTPSEISGGVLFIKYW